VFRFLRHRGTYVNAERARWWRNLPSRFPQTSSGSSRKLRLSCLRHANRNPSNVPSTAAPLTCQVLRSVPKVPPSRFLNFSFSARQHLDHHLLLRLLRVCLCFLLYAVSYYSVSRVVTHANYPRWQFQIELGYRNVGVVRFRNGQVDNRA
jgi:hypothetical protein